MILALKLLLTPFFIASVSRAGRRWGPGVSGTLTGLPLTSGPVSFILALQYGPAFAAQAATGNLCGLASVCVFCLVYSLVALRTGWLASSAAAVAVFLAATFAWNLASWTLLPAFASLVITVVLVACLMPRGTARAAAAHLPGWDLPARMIVATVFVALLTTFANALGPQLSGLISPFPVFSLVLAAFAHQQAGPAAAARLLRGVVLGSSAYTCFFLIVGGLLPSLAIGWTYALATAAAIGVNAVFLIRAR